MLENDKFKLLIECTFFFHNRPFARETVHTLGLQLGKHPKSLQEVLALLVSFAILEQHGVGENSIFSYKIPDSYLDKGENVYE